MARDAPPGRLSLHVSLLPRFAHPLSLPPLQLDGDDPATWRTMYDMLLSCLHPSHEGEPEGAVTWVSDRSGAATAPARIVCMVLSCTVAHPQQHRPSRPLLLPRTTWRAC